MFKAKNIYLAAVLSLASCSALASSGGGGAIPAPSAAPTTTSLGGIYAKAGAIAHQVVQYIDTTGTQILVQLGANDITGLAASATTDTTNASNITSGTINAARIPTLNQNTTGSAASFTGNLSGDVSGTQSATTLAIVNTNVGTYNGITVNNKGLVTAATTALGTPSSATLTNATGLPLTTGVTGVLPAANGGAGSVNGILKANGSGTVSGATVGTDYQTPITLTTTGTTGAATFVSGTLNIPQYIGGVTSVSGDGSLYTNSSSTGAVSLTLGTQSANKIFAGPTTGSPSGPGFRSLVGGDLPNPSASTLGGVQSIVNTAHQWVNSISTLGVPSTSQPAFTDISGTASNAQIPAPTTSSLGGVQAASSATANQFITYINTSGVPQTAQPSFSNISGNLTNTQLASQSANTVLGALTATTPSGLSLPSCSGATNALTWTSGSGFGCNTISAGGTVSTSGSPVSGNMTKFSGSTTITNAVAGTDYQAPITLTTTGTTGAATFSSNTLNIPQYSGIPYPGAGIPNSTGSAWGTSYTTSGSGTVLALTTSPVFTTPNLGTPSAVVLTNATGTAASLTAGTVTTNANLTGPITSTGNATSVAAQTGTGSTFAMSVSPAFTGTVTGAADTWSGLTTSLNFAATGTGADTLPVGTTAQRPTGASGLIRYNSTTTAFEGYQNSSWATLQPAIGSGMLTTASDNTTALQAALTQNYTLGQTTLVTDIGINDTQAIQGYYNFVTGGINTRPWTKLKCSGTCALDFSGMSTSGTAINETNDTPPTGVFAATDNAGNEGAAIQGPLFIKGPSGTNGTTGTAIGLTIGGTTASTNNDASLRMAYESDITIDNFYNPIKWHTNNNYMHGLQHAQIVHFGGNGITSDSNSSNYNSGERQWAWDVTFGNGTGAAYAPQSPNLDTIFWNTSADFVGNVFAGSTNDTYNVKGFLGGHIEAIGNNISNYGGTGTLSANSEAEYFAFNKFIANSTYTPAPAVLFTGGAHYLDLQDFYVGGYNSATLAASSMFMVGPNITLIGNKGKGITYSNYAQMISPNTVLNDDPYFTNTGSNGSACNTAATISEDAVSGISCTIDTGTVWTAGGATKSLKFTYTGASNYDVVTFDRFPVEAGDRLIANTAFYGGTSTGTDAVQLQFIYSYCNAGLATSTDGSAYGDSTSSLYTGARTSWGMMASLRQATVPVGVCYAQLSVTISQLASGDVFRLGAAVVNKE